MRQRLAGTTATLRLPGIRDGTGATNDRESPRHRRARARRLGRERASARARRRAGRDEPELVLLCVPDRAIAEVAAAIEPGPVGRTRERRDAARRARPARAPLRPPSAADVHERRGRSSSTARGRRSRPRPRMRAPPASGSPDPRPAAVRARRRASAPPTTRAPRSPRTTSSRCARPAGSLLEAAGAPPEALDPLMRRMIENDFELTGPIARGDWATVERHLEAIRADAARARGALPRRSPRRPHASLAASCRATRCREARAHEDRAGRSRSSAPRSRVARRLDRARADDGRASRRPPARCFAPRARSATRSS